MHSHSELNWNQNACIFVSAVTVTAAGVDAVGAPAAAAGGRCMAIWPLETNSRDLIALLVYKMKTENKKLILGGHIHMRV